MNHWILLKQGESIPELPQYAFVRIALREGKILRVLFRFVKNIRSPIAAYLVEQQAEARKAH